MASDSLDQESLQKLVAPFQEFAKDRLNLPSLRLCLNPTLTANVTNHRALVRELLVKTIEKSFPSVPRELRSQVLKPGTVMALQNPESTSLVYFSLSHTQSCTGYAVAYSDSPLGFDLEEASRVTPKLLKRIKHSDDLPDALNSPMLWSAKESAFKAIFMNESSTLSQIAITSWRQSQNGFISFEARGAGTMGSGVASKIQSLSIAIFLKGPSFSR